MEFLPLLTLTALIIGLTHTSVVIGLVRFTNFPPSVLFVSSGGTARFVWDYHVDNKATEFDQFASPLWFYETSPAVIGADVSSDGWNWKIYTSTCPPRLLNPTRVNRESKATLVITNVIAADNGTYGCTLVLRNSSTITNTSRLFITVPPQFISGEPPSTKSINENQEVTIRCSARGYPTPNITWFQLGQSSKVELQQGVGSALLVISKIQRNQSGIYVCEAVNNKDEKPVSTVTTVTVYYPAEIVTSPNNVTITEGRTIELNCIASGHPKPSIIWSRSIPAVTIKPESIHNDTLIIQNVKKYDSGKYTCEAKNFYDGHNYTVTAEVHVAVRYQPSIQNISQDHIIKERASLHLTCIADGYPTPNITWSKSPGTITPSVTTGNEYNILSANRSDAGVYKCTASNGIGNSTWAKIQVTVQYKPTIDVSLSTSHIESWNGYTVTLTCIADGLPAPDIKWYKNGGQLITSGVTLFMNGSQLKITTKDSIDYGSYECEARNSVGGDKHLIKITQLFPPGPPNITMSEDDIKAVSITVNWTKPVSDGGTPVLDYKVRVNSTNPPQEKNTSGNHVGFSGLRINTKYVVKVFARNKVGYGEPSIKIITTKKQGAPSSPDIKLQSNDTAITLNWSKPDENGGEITKYTIYSNGDEIGVVTRNSDLKFVIDIEKLEPGTTYSFIVTATNEYGESVKDNSKAQRIRIPEVTTPSATTAVIISTTAVITPDKEERQDDASSSSPIVIAGAVGAVVLFIIAAVIVVIILRKKNLLGQGIKRSSKTNRATYHNDIDPDSGIHQGAVVSLNDEAEGGIPTYAAVDISKKKNKAADIPNYAAVDMTKKKRPGEIIYAELADFNTAGTSVAEASRPITYTGTDYADISQFQKQDEPEATYANFPGRNKNFTNIQGM